MADEVTLTVTVAKPMLPPGTVDWDELIAAPFRILRRVDSPPPPHGGSDWESEWQLELPAQQTPWIVRKAVTQVTPSTVVTALAKGPESPSQRWTPAWSLGATPEDQEQ